MLKGEKVLGIIPARGGSKRIPRKNVRPFQGQSLVSRAIASTGFSKYLDRVVVSTDDAEIKQIAENLNHQVIDRPAHLATDTAASEDVMRHVLTVLPDYRWIVLLQPTSPYRTAEDIDGCLELLLAKFRNTSAGFTVTPEGKTNGAVYVCTAEWLERGNSFNTNAWFAKYVMPMERSLDIDTEEQWIE